MLENGWVDRPEAMSTSSLIDCWLKWDALRVFVGVGLAVNNSHATEPSYIIQQGEEYILLHTVSA